MLTPAAVKAAQPQARAYKLFDARSLFLFVAPNGLKSWRMKYRRAGRETVVALGRYPVMSLPEARAARDAAKERLRTGAAPIGAKAEVDEISTFGQLARAWHADQAKRWSAVHAADALASLERDVFPVLGEELLASIDAPMVLQVLEQVEGRGRLVTGKRIRQRISSVFRYGIALKHCTEDPAAILVRMMAPARPPLQHAALLTAEECRQLLARCYQADVRPVVMLASRFLALTAVRLDAVRGMCWGEIEDLDGAEPTWRVPAARMKLAKVKKDDPRFDHFVPLSAQAVQVLQVCRAVLDHVPDAGELVFRSGAKNVPIGEGAMHSEGMALALFLSLFLVVLADDLQELVPPVPEV